VRAVSRSSEADIEAAVRRIKKVTGGWVRGTTVVQMRTDWDQLFSVDHPAAQLTPINAGGVPAVWVIAPGARFDRAILYLHGGGFQIGSTNSHAELMVNISRAAGCAVLGLNYRRAPEYIYPIAIQDTRAAYDWLCQQMKSPSYIGLAGDSAGGNLVLLLVLALRDEGKHMPAGAALLSPWTDLTAQGASYKSPPTIDPIHQRPMVMALAKTYLGGRDAASPLVSPLFADFHGLPPLLVQVGDREILLSDSVSLAEACAAKNVTVDLTVWSNMFHVFQQFSNDLVEARSAIAAIGRFFHERLNTENGHLQ
jgi:monoterpene epsilon-lactone hydrolase